MKAEMKDESLAANQSGVFKRDSGQKPRGRYPEEDGARHTCDASGKDAKRSYLGWVGIKDFTVLYNVRVH